jgi:NTP pyrophosphatase (non-canonical NTP hydrolase)
MNPTDRAAKDPPDSNRQTLTLSQLQSLIREMYSPKDEARGIDGTFMWLMEEVGELAAALRQGPKAALAAEFADVLAWLATIANVAGIDLEQAVLEKYGGGCPGCGQMVCACDLEEKP